MLSVSDSQEFRTLLQEHWPELSVAVLDKVTHYRELVVAENENQNLTRLISPKDFLLGHVLDVKELLKLEKMGRPALDMGSGAGVPGLLSAVLRPDTWILSESEGKKAEFLLRATEILGLQSSVRVYAGRAEDFLKREKADTVVARAVGPIERIYGWIGKCSTWNKLVLFKGPKWKQEWEDSQNKPWIKNLQILEEQRYNLPGSEFERFLIVLGRVPRGT